jgi:Lrp/AsnC family transcriptional regulator, leucine-responsive regulatory protein
MLKTSTSTLDTIDKTILRMLQTQGDVSNAELARLTHLSAPAVSARIKRLRDEGFIARTVTVLNRERLGFDLVCFIHISLSAHRVTEEEKLRDAVAAMPEVLECFHITGEYDYVLKVVARDRGHLEQLVNARLTPLVEGARIKTSLALAEIKSTTAIEI